MLPDQTSTLSTTKPNTFPNQIREVHLSLSSASPSRVELDLGQSSNHQHIHTSVPIQSSKSHRKELNFLTAVHFKFGSAGLLKLTGGCYFKELCYSCVSPISPLSIEQPTPSGVYRKKILLIGLDQSPNMDKETIFYHGTVFSTATLSFWLWEWTGFLHGANKGFFIEKVKELESK